MGNRIVKQKVVAKWSFCVIISSSLESLLFFCRCAITVTCDCFLLADFSTRLELSEDFIINFFINNNYTDLIGPIFFSSLHYQNSSQKLKDVAKFMNFRGARADSVFSGHYTLSDDKVRLCFFKSVKVFFKFWM